ncbi:MAG: hypothetical protein KAT06_09185 [Gammaproteobacteria bacterium]|nr:hypothetical protein [Gammaproteobacteria bacterium]
MLTTNIIQDEFGQRYVLKTSLVHFEQSDFKAKSFWNAESTRSFVQRLNVSHGYWPVLLQQFSTLPALHTLQKQQIEFYVSELLISGKIHLYPLPKQKSDEHAPQKRAIKSSDNVTYLFAEASLLLTSTPKEVKYFSSSEDAETFIKELSPDDEKLQTIASELDIKVPTTASVNPAELTTAICSALVAGSVIVLVDRISTVPASASELVEAVGPGNKKADLGPAPDEFKEINIELDDEFEKNMAAHFSLFDGLEYKIKTDIGEEHKGTVENGKIFIAKAKMNSSFEIEIKDLPAFMDS